MAINPRPASEMKTTRLEQQKNSVQPSPAEAAPWWRELATTAAAEFKERLGVARYLSLSDKDRERFARRLRDAIDSAMEVPPDLPDRIRADIEVWREDAAADPVALAWQRARERARRTAAVGAVTSLPAMIPVLGPAAAALGLVADWRSVAEQQRDLVLEIAALFGVIPEDPTEQVRRLFLASAGTSFGAKAAGETAVKVMASQVARRSVARIIPGAGMAVVGALNYMATLAIGRAAIAQFGAQAGREIRGLIPAAAHPEFSQLRRATIGAVELAELSPEEGPVYTADDNRLLAELSDRERDELMDLAIVTAAADARATEREDRTLSEIATALGIDTGQLAAMRADAEREVAGYGDRLRELLLTARNKGDKGRKRLWRRARKLARRE